MSWILVVHEELLFFVKKSLVPPTLPENRTKRKPQNHSNQRIILGILYCRRGRTLTLSPDRYFKSLVSASLQQSHFSFIVSFDLSLRERFFLREREGFALFDKTILPHFSLHVNHAKLFHLVVLDLRSARDPGRSPCPDALLGVGDDGLDNGLVGVLMDGIEGWVIADFWRLLLKRLGLF